MSREMSQIERLQAERSADRFNNEALKVINEQYGGNAWVYILRQFGQEALDTVQSIARDAYKREQMASMLVNSEDYFRQFSLRYAVNRAAFRAITRERGYQMIERQLPATGNELVAVMTRSGSMLFTYPGAFVSSGEVVYLPISGREVTSTTGVGLATPFTGTFNHSTGAFNPDALLYRGALPIKGQSVWISGMTALQYTSPAIEVGIKAVSRMTGTNDAGALIHGMQHLNRSLR